MINHLSFWAQSSFDYISGNLSMCCMGVGSDPQSSLFLAQCSPWGKFILSGLKSLHLGSFPCFCEGNIKRHIKSGDVTTRDLLKLVFGVWEIVIFHIFIHSMNFSNMGPVKWCTLWNKTSSWQGRKFKSLKASRAVPLWCGTAVQRWQNGDANVPFVCVLISTVTATLNPLIYSRKQWKRNCSHDWLSGDAAQADKNWTHDQVACMPLEHIIPSAIWFKDTILEPYKENTVRNNSRFYVHGADPEHHPILWDTSVPLVTW